MPDNFRYCAAKAEHQISEIPIMTADQKKKAEAILAGAANPTVT
jgi:hypothetical protein